MDEKMKPYGDGIHDDTEAIQAMLDRCGTVCIPDGRYLITKPLIIHSNTHLILSSQATLRLADGANCSLLDNDGSKLGIDYDPNEEFDDSEFEEEFEDSASEEDTDK